MKSFLNTLLAIGILILYIIGVDYAHNKYIEKHGNSHSEKTKLSNY